MTGRSQTLLILSPAFPPSGPDTNWVISQQLMVRTLKETYPGVPIVVLAFLYPDRPGTYEWKGVKVITFNGIKKRKWRRVFLWIKIWKTIKGIDRTDGIKGIFSFWCGECALLGKYFGRLHGIRHLCWICGQDARKSNRYVRLIRPRPDELVAMSGFLAHQFQKNHAVRPLHIVPNGIDPGQFAPSTIQERDIDILGVGSLENFKQYSLFVDIIKFIQDHISGIRAMLCGNGPERDTLEALARDLGIENALQFPGLTPHQDVLTIMLRTKVLLHTSNYEGFSTVCLEALYAGAHVISFCDPMQGHIDHWHIVHTKAEMIGKALELLRSSQTEYKPVLAYRMKDSARALMNIMDKSSVMEQNISFYNGIADQYNDTMRKDPTNRVVRQKVREKVIRLVPSGCVMDFGGGTGLDLAWLAAGHTVLFCEPSIKMREKAIAYNRDLVHSDQIVFLRTDQSDYTRWHEALPVSIKSDAVLCNFGVLNYIPDIRYLFSILAMVLKPGGHLIAVVLAFSLKKRLRWHRRHAIASLVTGKPFVMYIPSAEGKQTVTVHSIREIAEAAAPYFEPPACESLGGDFIFVQLIRK